MFGINESKKKMLDNLKASKRTGRPIHQLQQNLKYGSDSKASDCGTSSSPSPNPRRSKAVDSGEKEFKLKSDSIEKDFDRSDIHGVAIRKIAQKVSKFRTDRDGILLQSFTSASLDYPQFRKLLKTVYQLIFTDEEFKHICALFDANGDGSVDGNEFLVCVKLLSSTWKAREARKVREESREYEGKLAEQREKEKVEKEAILENAADKDFTEEDEKSALAKLDAAAFLYDKNSASAVGLEGFSAKYLKPHTFKELLKNTFNIVLNRKELGALVLNFDSEDIGLVDSSSFLIKFSMKGLELRNERRILQLEKCRKAEEDSKRSQRKKLEDAHLKMEVGIDAEFTQSDKERALHKVKVAATLYRKGDPASLPLDGFNGTHVTFGIFRELLKRTFNLTLTNPEFAALSKHFDTDGIGKVSCDTFLTHFTKVGVEERNRMFSENLEKQRKAEEAQRLEEQRKLEEKWKKAEEKLHQVQGFTLENVEVALGKLRRAARAHQVESAVGSSLAAFDCKVMTVGVFKEICKRCMHIEFTGPEVAALQNMFPYATDPEGAESTKKEVDVVAFVNKYKLMSLEEKDKRWSELRSQRARDHKAEQDELKAKVSKQQKQHFSLDLDVSEEDKESGLTKLKKAVASYERHHPAAMSLSGFESPCLPPAVVKSLLKSTFSVDLSPKEFGGVVQPYLVASENINAISLLNHIMHLSRHEKAEKRYKKIETNRAYIEAMLKEDEEREAASKKKSADRLVHDEEDRKSLMAKLKEASQLFVIDSATYALGLRVFKGPALTAHSFRATFNHVFPSCNVSLPEVGVLIKLINEEHAKEHMIDGNRFLRVFYRLVRLQERVLLGLLEEEHIDISVIRPEFAVNEKPELGAKISKRPTSASGVQTGVRLKPNSLWVNTELGQTKKGEENDTVEAAARSPMLPAVVGMNPWQDWGLAEAGYLFAMPASRPASRSQQAPPSAGRDQDRSRSPPRPARAATAESFFPPHGGGFSLTLPTADFGELRFDAAEPNDERKGATVHFGSLPSDFFMTKKEEEPKHKRLIYRGKKEVRDPLQRVSLPAAFSPIGLARQQQKKQSGVLSPLLPIQQQSGNS